MNEVIKFLSENTVEYLATLGLDGQAKVRPIMYYFEEMENLTFVQATKSQCLKNWKQTLNLNLQQQILNLHG